MRETLWEVSRRRCSKSSLLIPVILRSPSRTYCQLSKLHDVEMAFTYLRDESYVYNEHCANVMNCHVAALDRERDASARADVLSEELSQALAQYQVVSDVVDSSTRDAQVFAASSETAIHAAGREETEMRARCEQRLQSAQSEVQYARETAMRDGASVTELVGQSRIMTEAREREHAVFAAAPPVPTPPTTEPTVTTPCTPPRSPGHCQLRFR